MEKYQEISLSTDLELDHVIAIYVLTVLYRYDHNRTKAAESLGLSVRTMRHYCQWLRDIGFLVPAPKKGIKQPKVRRRKIR